LKALAATACAFALASAVQAATYTDSSDNYELNHMLATGDNGGDGFGAWEVETHGSGIDGAWAGCGIWDPSANDFQGDWAGKTKAFGIIGKGDGYGANAYRPFRAPLAVGDSFSLEMGVNWDSNAGIDALKGFALLAEGGTLQVLTINHRSNPGAIAINGETDDILNIDEGTYPMKWTFTAKDATTLTVTMTPRDGSKTIYEKDWTVDTSALDGFRLQSSNQNPYEDEKAAEERGETPQMWADRRQTYFDNFTLDVAADLPDLLDLEFTGGEYAVTSNNQELSYTLKRPSSDGELTVNVKSSFEAFIPSTTATFADGESETTFTVTATLQPKVENKANLTVSALGFNPAVYANVRAPRYRFSSDTATVEKDATANIWINWDDNGVRDDSKLAFVADPEDIVTLPAAWELTGEATDDGGNYIGLYGQTSISGLAYGYTLLSLTYDGVVVGDWGFTVPAPVVPGFELSGPATAKTGAAAVFTLKATLDGSEEGCSVSVEPADGVTVDPASFDLVEHAEDGFYYQDIEVTFATAGDYTVSVASPNYSAELPVSVSEPADFSDYIAYDDGSLYAGDFDAAATGEGTDKFQAWDIVTKNSGDIFLAHSAPDASVLTDGAAFGIWANGADNAELQIRRPFVNSLGDGQAFSVVLSPNWRAGTKGVKFMGEWEGGWYERAEFYYNDYGYFYKLDGDQEGTSLDWEYSAEAITITLQKAADGSSYTLTFERGNAKVPVSGITSFQGTVDAVQFYSYQGGSGNENNLVFNKLAIEQVEQPVEPVAKRNIGIMGTWNPDATGDYDFYVGPSEAGDEAIGTVNLTVTPDDGRIAISPTSVEVPGDNVVAFTVTVNSLPAEGEQAVTYTIKATPVDEMVNSAEFNVTPAQPYVYLSSDNNQLTTDDGPIGLVLHASPARYGEYRVTTDDDSVFSIPENYQTVTLSEEQPEATFFVDIVGPSGENGASIYATLGEGEAWCDYRFWVSEGPDDPYADILRITAMDKADPNMVLTVDGTPATAYGATEIVGGDWAWQPLDDATIAGDKVTVPMTGRPYLIIKVEK
jgi:hypothetical protein